MSRRKRKNAVILSWILGFSFLLSAVSIPAGDAKAATPVEEQYPVALSATEVYDAASGYNFALLLQESLYLYDANMCGSDVDEKSGFTWRTDCHTGDANITYNGKVVDLSGGYHDAGDHVKFGLPQAYSASVLGISYYQFKDAFKQTGSEDHYIRIADRFVEYFEKCTILDDSGNVLAFCYQVGSGVEDHNYWGAPENQGQRARAWFTDASTPATDIVCETAAALAIYYCNFKDTKPAEAKTALSYAEKLFSYANNNSKAVAVIETDNATGSPFYKSTSWEDDYALAAAWLYKATGDSNYMTYYNNVFGSRNWCGWVLSWDDVSAAALLYGPNASTSASYVSSYIDSAKNNTKDNGQYVFLTNWGSARYNAALQFMGLAYDNIKSSNTYGEWAEGQMNYLLGSNPGNHCFVVGYNSMSVKYPHHRAASGYTDVSANATTPLKHVLVGALVGGPDSDSSSYVDSATNYATNEVALDYNAGLVGAAAGLYLYKMQYGTTAEKAAQVVVDEMTLTSEMRESVVSSKSPEPAELSKPVINTLTSTSSGVQISWDKVDGAEKYRVFYRLNSNSSWTKIADTEDTSYTWTEAKNGTTYIFTVRCISSDGKSYTSSYDSTGKSITYSSGILATPTISSVSNVNSGVQITWGKVDGAEKYRVFYRLNSNSSWTKIADTADTSYTWTGAKNGTTYIFTVRCISSDGNNYTSNYDSTGKSFTYSSGMLATPSISSVSNVNGGVQITWGKVDGAEKYRVFYRLNSNSSWTKIADTADTSYTWTGTKSGTTYIFTVRCVSSDGNSYTSSYDSAGKSITASSGTLETPSISSVSNVNGGVQISWGKVDGAEKYRVYYKIGSGSWTRIADTTSTNYTWTGAESGTTYAFTVRCINSDATSFTSSYDSTGKSIQYVAAPQITSLNNVNGGVQIKWDAVSGAEKYRVYYKTGSGSWTRIADTTSTSYTWTGAQNGTTYSFTVRCINSDATSFTSGYDSIGKSILYSASAYFTIDFGNGKTNVLFRPKL